MILIKSMLHGGAERQAVVDACALHKRGHKVTIAYHKEGPLSALLDKGIELYRIKYKNIFAASCRLTWKLMRDKYDTVFAHMFWAEKAAAVPAALTGHKLILVEHGLGLWRKWYHILVMKFAAALAHRVLCVCEATRGVRLQREKLRPGKLQVIYNSFQIAGEPGIEIVPDQARDYFTIGFVGRFAEIKRIGTFVEIAKRLKKRIKAFKIILVGDGEENERIKEEIKRNALDEYFLLTGFALSPSRYYRSFDIFVLPSKREAFPIVLLEAGAWGIPCLAFDVGGNSEIIRDGKTGFILPDYYIGQMVERIMMLYEKPAKRKEMGIAAEKFVKERFSIEKRLLSLEKLIKEI